MEENRKFECLFPKRRLMHSCLQRENLSHRRRRIIKQYLSERLLVVSRWRTDVGQAAQCSLRRSSLVWSCDVQKQTICDRWLERLRLFQRHLGLRRTIMEQSRKWRVCKKRTVWSCEHWRLHYDYGRRWPWQLVERCLVINRRTDLEDAQSQ